MRKILLAFFLFLTPFAFAANSYADMGINNKIGQTPKGGGRIYRGNCALDFSSKGMPSQPESRKDFTKKNNVKSMVLLYPDASAQNRFYFGGGISSGIGPNANKFLKQSSAEGIIGYEFRTPSKKTILYTQLEATQSMDKGHKPEIRARIGFNF